MSRQEMHVTHCPSCSQKLRFPAKRVELRITCPSCRYQWVWSRDGREPSPPPHQDYYEVLQVSPNADLEIIQAAYKRLVLRYHPDRNPGDQAARRMMLKINEVFEVLSDQSWRAEYDRKRQVRPPGHTQAPNSRAEPVQPEPEPQSESPADEVETQEEVEVTRKPEEDALATGLGCTGCLLAVAVVIVGSLILFRKS